MQLGSLLSIRGCFYNHKIGSNRKCYSTEDTEQGLYMPLAHGVNGNGVRVSEKLDNHGTLNSLITSGVWDDLYQVLFQVYLIVFFPVEETATQFCSQIDACQQ